MDIWSIEVEYCAIISACRRITRPSSDINHNNMLITIKYGGKVKRTNERNNKDSWEQGRLLQMSVYPKTVEITVERVWV